MIAANELRIGNWLKDGEGAAGAVIRIVPEEGGVEMAYSDGGKPFGTSIWQETEGIPLTPEILEKSGFEFSHGCWEKDGIKIGEYEEWEGEEVFRLEICEWIAFKAPDLKFVHQLQNLFHGLTGQELNIQL